MVDVHVGEDKKSGHFKIHKTILCQKVPYFEKTFDGGFLEGTTNSATLPDDDPEAFNIFVSVSVDSRVTTKHLYPMTLILSAILTASPLLPLHHITSLICIEYLLIMPLTSGSIQKNCLFSRRIIMIQKDGPFRNYIR